MKNSYNGVVNLYKEGNMSSNTAMQKVRAIFDRVKGGHTGTLDPDAEGVLPIVLGKCTKLSDMIMSDEKEYTAVLKLGVTTDTLDLSGTVLTTNDTVLDSELVINTINSFQKEYEQLPPMYSAIKINGQKLYDLARQGIEIERKKRLVNISKIVVKEKIDDFTYVIDVTCSKGTYIRSLCADIGEELKVGAAMGKLIRTRTGDFTADKAYTLSQLEEMKSNGTLESAIIKPDVLLSQYDKVVVKSGAKKFVDNGNKLGINYFENKDAIVKDNRYLVYFENKLVGLYEFDGEFLSPVVILS